MTSTRKNYFGSTAQIALLKRGRALYDLLGDDPGIMYYGRNVGLAASGDRVMDRLAALVALQGSSTITMVEDSEVEDLTADAGRRNLSTTRYDRWRATGPAMLAARALLDRYPLPADLTVVRIGPDTPDETLAQLAQVSLSCNVLPPSGAVLRGVLKPGLGLVALDRSGRGVACAGAASYLHPDHAEGSRQCWWGMLATLPERRGERLALILGAMALIGMQERFGFTEVFTGIEPGNVASETVCTRLGLTPEGKSALSIADATQLPGGRMTK